MRFINFFIATLICCVLSSVCTYAYTIATSIDSTTIISYIGHLNEDKIADTLYYQKFAHNFEFPCFIKWGKNDTLLPRFSQTDFSIANWSNIKSSFSVMNFDDDTIKDITIIIRGKKPTTNDTTIQTDTAFSVAIMGGHGLDTNQTVNLADLPEPKPNKYYAIIMKIGTHLVDPKTIKSDLGSVLVFTIKGVSTPPAGGGAQRKPIEEIPKLENKDNDDFTISVFPNPVSNEATVAFNNIPSGEFSIVIHDMKGDDRYKTTVKASDGGDLVKKIDLKDLTDGVYFLTVSSQDSIFGTYKIIILH